MNSKKLTAYGPLPIRIVSGIAFMVYGLPKLSNIAATQHLFSHAMGLPAAMALPIGLLEVIGGIAILTGILTRIAAILFIIEMIGSTIIIIPEGFVHGYDLALLLLSISASLILTGPGKVSIEWDILNREIFPKDKQIIMRNKKALEETSI
ncbi:MAG: DoxX family protein [Candidatus Nitrosopolaris sp.]